MARTGISIKVSNTVLGSPPQVNANSMLVVVGATATTGSAMPFTLNTPFMLQSADDLTTLGITATNNRDVYNQVNDFYAPMPGVSTSGTILWLVGMAKGDDLTTWLTSWVMATVKNGFQYRPRNILISYDPTTAGDTVADLQKMIDDLYSEGFSTCIVTSGNLINGAVSAAATTLPDLSTLKAGMVGTVIITNRQQDRACVGAIGGWMSTLSVGTSVGDTSLQAFGDSLYFLDGTSASGTINWINTPCSSVSTIVLNTLGDKQYIFARTRPPRNGLWLNDGATAEDPATALSTLEAARTIAAIVDDARAFFTPYINSKVPVNADGDIQPTYKQVVLDNARSAVLQPYIDSGDISDGRISLKALNNDMVGTRTWEVTIEILPASTLRWVNGYVFYVKSLT